MRIKKRHCPPLATVLHEPAALCPIIEHNRGYSAREILDGQEEAGEEDNFDDLANEAPVMQGRGEGARGVWGVVGELATKLVWATGEGGEGDSVAQVSRFAFEGGHGCQEF